MAYGDKVAVDGLSLEVTPGSITAVLGPNGAGKTTTLETCEGYRVAQRGTVRVLGLDPQRDRAELLPRIGVMLQSGGAWSGVRAVEMLEHMASLHAHPLDTVVFVDEPTAGMDPQARRTTWEMLEEVRADGVTVVLTTHHMDEAEHLADRIHIIDRGTLIASGTPAELTRGGHSATIRLVVNRPFPDGAPESLRRELGPLTEVRQLDEVSMLIHGPADASTLGRVSRWCEEHAVP